MTFLHQLVQDGKSRIPPKFQELLVFCGAPPGKYRHLLSIVGILGTQRAPDAAECRSR